MTEIFNGRYTARTDKPLVLFLIGIRLNKLWAVHKWLPVFIAMPRMLAELDRKPEAGLLSHRAVSFLADFPCAAILGLVR